MKKYIKPEFKSIELEGNAVMEQLGIGSDEISGKDIRTRRKPNDYEMDEFDEFEN